MSKNPYLTPSSIRTAASSAAIALTPTVRRGWRSLFGVTPAVPASQVIPTKLKMARSYTKTMTKKKTKKGGKHSFAAAVRRLNPFKHISHGDSAFTSGMLNNLMYTTNLTSKITQGTDDKSRLGDSVYLVALKLNGMFVSNTVADWYKYRLIVFYSGEEYNPTTSLTAGFTTGEIFISNPGQTTFTDLHLNPKAVTVVLDKTFDVNSLLDGVSDVVSFTERISLGTKFNYQASGSVYGKNRNLYCVMMGCVGTGGAVSAGYFRCTSDLIFQD